MTATTSLPIPGREALDYSSRPARVLVIDDEALMRTMLARYLPRIGYDAVAIRSCREGCALLEGETWHAVVMSMPLARGTSGRRFVVFREPGGTDGTSADTPLPQVLTAPFRLEDIGEALRLVGVAPWRENQRVTTVRG